MAHYLTKKKLNSLEKVHEIKIILIQQICNEKTPEEMI